MSCCYGDETRGGVLRLQSFRHSQQDRQTEQDKIHNKKNPRTTFSMYIKFCRSYGEDKKDEAGAGLSPESELSVNLEGGKGKQSQGNKQGNTRLYRAACIFLTIICLVLLLVIIILSVKLQTGSTVCSQAGEMIAPKLTPAAPTCSQEQCQALFLNIQQQHRNCQQCADGWLTFGQSCFFMSTYRLSWDESQRNCSARGGSLAIINSQSVQSFLTKEGKMTYWIGLKKNSDTWTWVNNTALRESYWAGVKTQGECGILSTENPPEKNWITASCQAYTYFICQLQM